MYKAVVDGKVSYAKDAASMVKLMIDADMVNVDRIMDLLTQYCGVTELSFYHPLCDAFTASMVVSWRAMQRMVTNRYNEREDLIELFEAMTVNDYDGQETATIDGALVLGRVRRCMEVGHKIDAIKLVRYFVPSADLKSAKDFVEGWAEAGYPMDCF